MKRAARSRAAPLLVRRLSHACIREMAAAGHPVGLCPACRDTLRRIGPQGQSVICDCFDGGTVHMALNWLPSLPEYPPPQYDTCEEVEDA